MELFVRDFHGEYRLASSQELMTGARAAIAREFTRGIHLQSPTIVRDYLFAHLADAEREMFIGIYVTATHSLIATETLSVGTIDSASVYPREVLKSALKCNAAAVIFAHNHPSGIPEPSSADRTLTQRLCDTLKLVDIKVLDHLVIGGDRVVSFAERGWI